MTEPKRKVGRPRDPGVTVVRPEDISDWETRPMFELTIHAKLPTANTFQGLPRRELFRMKKDMHTAIHSAFSALRIPMTSDHRRRGTGKQTKFQLTWRLPANMVFPCRAVLHPTIYRTDNHECDPHNYVFPLDKLVLDLLTEPTKAKWRGFGLLVDDRDRFLYMFRPEVEYMAQQDAIVLHFYAHRLPDYLQKD